MKVAFRPGEIPIRDYTPIQRHEERSAVGSPTWLIPGRNLRYLLDFKLTAVKLMPAAIGRHFVVAASSLRHVALLDCDNGYYGSYFVVPSVEFPTRRCASRNWRKFQ